MAFAQSKSVHQEAGEPEESCNSFSSCASLCSAASTISSTTLSEAESLCFASDLGIERPIEDEQSTSSDLSFVAPSTAYCKRRRGDSSTIYSGSGVACADIPFLKLFETASDPQMERGRRKRRLSNASSLDAMDSVTIAAFVAVAAAERAAADRSGTSGGEDSSDSLTAGRGLCEEGEIEEFSVGSGTPFTSLSPIATAAVAAAAAVSFAKRPH
mmetsp:Transcript_57723/g.151905  ORF Transcript_57723/g.151905 Transcript_57723/m.151905 type:complete len:214 (+) Transcript_57723:55-696(+)